MDNREELRKKMLERAKQGMKSTYEKEEFILIQASNAFEESNKSYNLANERLSEWFGLYIPELKVGNFITLANLAIMLADNNPDRDKIIELVGNDERGEHTYKMINETIGRELSENERKTLRGFAEYTLSILKGMDTLAEYIKATSERLLPNVTYLTDDKMAAELLSKAGSIERLATMPASTIQLLGAEKALFKHIKYGSRPPKYGVLFKLADVTSAPKDKKGRIARVYATKIAIALKADYYSKRFIGDVLKTDLKKSLDRIMSSPHKDKVEFDKNSMNRGRFRGNRGGENNSNRRQHVNAKRNDRDKII
ncbi:MAG: hypothetical protein M1385_00175, partial [Candidatus Marsarchaeota archaeon]|nr:hypothetical protein [Candidatus Marsarchaeota archaeon]